MSATDRALNALADALDRALPAPYPGEPVPLKVARNTLAGVLLVGGLAVAVPIALARQALIPESAQINPSDGGS